MYVLLRRLLQAPGFRFLLAGGFAAAVNWLIRFPFSSLMPLAEAVVAAQVVGWVVGFTLYRSFVFAPSGRSIWQEILAFGVVSAFSLLGVLAVTLELARLLQAAGLGSVMAEAVAHAIGIATGAVMNFLGHRAFTFAATAGRPVSAAE